MSKKIAPGAADAATERKTKNDCSRKKEGSQMIFYSDDPERDFERWDAWCQRENARTREERR